MKIFTAVIVFFLVTANALAQRNNGNEFPLKTLVEVDSALYCLNKEDASRLAKVIAKGNLMVAKQKMKDLPCYVSALIAIFEERVDRYTLKNGTKLNVYLVKTPTGTKYVITTNHHFEI